MTFALHPNGNGNLKRSELFLKKYDSPLVVFTI